MNQQIDDTQYQAEWDAIKAEYDTELATLKARHTAMSESLPSDDDQAWDRWHRESYAERQAMEQRFAQRWAELEARFPEN